MNAMGERRKSRPRRGLKRAEVRVKVRDARCRSAALIVFCCAWLLA